MTPGLADVERFRADWSRTAVALSPAPVLIAVSGGADSLALLLLFAAEMPGRCIVATVDHRLREASAGEATYVAELCGARGIPHATLTGELPDRTAGSANLSQRARALRYDLLHREAARVGACRVATAHHADDQAETLLMRLNRGSGVAGLAGIRADNGRVIRPVLDWRRADLARVVAECGVHAVDDPSNCDERYDRARLRQAIAGADWLDVGNAALSARYLADADAALGFAADALAAERCRFGEGTASLRAAGLPSELRRRLVARCVLHVRPDARPRGSAIARAVEALERREAVMVADVLCEADVAGAVWRFRPAPPRRG